MYISAPSSKARLRIGGVDAQALVRRFGSPLYVYSQDVVLRRLRYLRSCLRRPGSLLCYALKANSNRALCRVISGAGAGAEVVSGGELLRALAAGFAPERVVFSGVGKTSDEMMLGLRRGVLTFNVESQEELAALARLARRVGKAAPFSIRLNPDIKARTHPHVTTGRAENKFGVEADEARRMALASKSDRWLRFQGLHCHIGSQLTDLGPFRKAAASVARLLRELASRGVRAALVDMGGGLGVRYDSEPELDVRALARIFSDAFAPWPETRLLLEPGRFLVADAGALLTTVLFRKRTSKRSFVVVDAGMNDLGRPALYDAYHPIVPVKPRSGPSKTVDVVGPVCESGDFLARKRPLPPVEPGDVLAVLKSGAYGFTMSSQYNSRPRAAEVLVSGRRAFLIRRRETLADLVRHETGR
jgi:diaminopimelate decarboxylase